MIFRSFAEVGLSLKYQLFLVSDEEMQKAHDGFPRYIISVARRFERQ